LKHGFRVEGLGLKLGCRVWGLGFKLGLRIKHSCAREHHPLHSPLRRRANMAHVRQSRPDSVLSLSHLQCESLHAHLSCPFSARQRSPLTTHHTTSCTVVDVTYPQSSRDGGARPTAYRDISLIRNTHLPRIILGPLAEGYCGFLRGGALMSEVPL
jgi:hypothetical protein